MPDYQELTHGRNRGTPANTVGRGRLLRTRPASCGARLRRSITNGGVANTTGRETMAAVLLLPSTPYVDSGACWSIRQKPARGQRIGSRHPPELDGRCASMEDGSARCGKAPTDIEQQRPHGCTTADRSRRCNCDGSGPWGRTKLVLMTSAGKRRTSRRSGVEKRMRRPLSFGTRLSLWRDTRRGCPL